jgi:ferric-dicitrate binding protein FerR (iron transport regulator)
MAIAAWRTGDLVYRDEMLKDIAADLERVFNDSIEIKTAALQKTMMTFSINREMGLQRALDMICRITGGRLSHERGIFIIE